ncbi:hypothetical protein [Streptomyces lydicamycinicus]|uniref:hypothetical protein n=1 Tax=Streptomyces lydicamycinicus TaxID=1546107 RepID=UPI003C2FD7C6
MDAILASTSTPLYKSPLSPVERAALRVAESAAISPAGGRDLTLAIVMELRAAGLLVVPADRSADTEYECPTCSDWSRWTRGRSITEGDMADEFQCPSCGATTYLATCNSRTSTAALHAENEYPPAMPWAALMDDEDRTDFLGELAASAITYSDTKAALAEVEVTCGRWRAIAEAQHAHNTAEGPDAVEGGDR